VKVLHITYSADRGGAGIACLELHKLLLRNGVESEVWTCIPTKKPHTNVYCPNTSLVSRIKVKLLKIFSVIVVKLLQRTTNPNVHTFDVFSSIDFHQINRSHFDVVHLHWINFCTLSIKDVTLITKPIVWTLHDLWYALGTEHHDIFNEEPRFISGYNEQNKNVVGVDMNKIAWEKKKRSWKDFSPILIAPSNWLSNSVKSSSLFSNEAIYVIPNVVSLRSVADKELLDESNTFNRKFKILVGAYDLNEPIKGGQFIVEVINLLNPREFQFTLFGKRNKVFEKYTNVEQLGYIGSRAEIAKIYNTSDCVLLPSMFENLPNIALESLKMKTPVVAFNVGGISDIVLHRKTGYLAEPFKIESLIEGVNFIKNHKNIESLKTESERHFNMYFSERRIFNDVFNIYSSCKVKNDGLD